MEKLTVIKVGGKIVEEPETLSRLLADFSALPGYKVLVHGGGRSATKLAAELGIESRMVNGRRITDADMLKVVTMVYGGLVNKNIVAGLQAKGVNAMGLTGADMDVMRSVKRPVKDVDYGFVGDVKQVNADLLAGLIRQGVVPVMAPLTHDGEGHLLNTNADTIAGETAKALARHFEVTLVFCFEKKGVLRDADDDDSVIPVITPDLFRRYVDEGVIQGGMIPKLENSFSAVEAGVRQVIITLATALDGRSGTVINPKKKRRVGVTFRTLTRHCYRKPCERSVSDTIYCRSRTSSTASPCASRWTRRRRKTSCRTPSSRSGTCAGNGRSWTPWRPSA